MEEARVLWLRFSQSLARRRHRLSQAMVRSTIQRSGFHDKAFDGVGCLTISISRFGMTMRRRVEIGLE